MPEMEFKKFRLLTILAMSILMAVVLLGYRNFGQSVRYINDYADRMDYAERGLWSVTGQIPYVDIPNEYPQIPVYLFGLVTWLAKIGFPHSWPIQSSVAVIWMLLMMVITLLVIWQLWRLLPEGKKYLAWLIFLPSSIYFCLNRFDILPVYFGLLALSSLKKDHYLSASALLALGVYTKWYLALIFPFFLMYELRHTHRLPWRSLLVFGGVSLIILVPTFIQGGWPAVWQPYAFHLARKVEPGTLLWFVYVLTGRAEGGLLDGGILGSVFTVLQFSGVILAIILRFNSIRKVTLVSIISILTFIFFSRIYSPQWWIWALPFLILTIESRIDLILVIFYDLVNYLTFPVIFDLFEHESIEYLALNGFLLILMLVLIARSARKVIMPEDLRFNKKSLANDSQMSGAK